MGETSAKHKRLKPVFTGFNCVADAVRVVSPAVSLSSASPRRSSDLLDFSLAHLQFKAPHMHRARRESA